MATSKYSKAVQDAICAALEKGAGKLEAAKAGGISPATFFQWLSKDGQFYNQDFSEAIKKACDVGDQAIREEGQKAIRKAGGQSWQAWAWILERRFPDEFGRRERIDARHDVDVKIKIVGDDIADDDE